MKKLYKVLSNKFFGYALIGIFSIFVLISLLFEDLFSNTQFWFVLGSAYAIISLKNLLEWIFILQKDDSGEIWLDQKISIVHMFMIPLPLIILPTSDFGLLIDVLIVLLIATKIIFEIKLAKKAAAWLKDGKLHLLYQDDSSPIHNLKSISNPKNIIRFNFKDDSNLELNLDYCRDKNLKRFIEELLHRCPQSVSLDEYMLSFMNED